MSYTEQYVATDDQPFCMFKMYNGKGLAKDNKIVETQSYKDYISKNIKDAEVETIEELGEFWDELGCDETWEEHKLSQMINGMLKEKILVFNPILAKDNKGYYFPSEVLMY
tara:strand:+ start:456 stop:788 length:333 start_codon:yes stop_codon:yes gene_type:complete